MTATPPRADLRTLAAVVAKDRAKRWGYTKTLGPVELANYVHRQAHDANLLADLAAVLPEHRQMVLSEVADFLEDEWPAGAQSVVLEHAADLPRRLAAAAPPAGLSAPVPAENAPAVPREVPNAQRAAEGPYRVGRKVGRTIYAQMYADGPSDEDVLIGVMDTRELAERAVHGMNALGFHEPDEPTDRIQAAFDAGTHGRTAPPRGQTRRLDVAGGDAQETIRRLTAERDDARAEVRRLLAGAAMVLDELNGTGEMLLKTRTERDRLAAQVAHYQRVVEQVRAIHIEFDGRCSECVDYCDCIDRVTELGDDVEVAAAMRMCEHGNKPWPCPTIAAVDALSGAGTDQTEDDHGV